MEKAKTIKKINVTATLTNMLTGSDVAFSTLDVDTQSVRSIASRLKKIGTFSVKKAGNKINVTRLS